MTSKTLVLVRLGALGDVVRILPLVSGLRRRHQASRIVWIVGAAVASLVQAHPGIDEVWQVPRLSLRSLPQWLRQARQLRQLQAQVCFDLQGLAKSAFWTWATGAPVRRGLSPDRAREGNSLVLTESLPGRPRSRYEEAVQLLGADWQDWQAGAEELRVAWSIPDGPRRGIFVHPGGSGRNRYKRWPAQRFAAAAAELQRRTGEEVLVNFGPGEQALAEELASSVPHAKAVGSTSLLELTRRIGSAALFLGGDSGPLHLAVLAGTRAVAIYGSSDPEVYALPPCSPHRIVRFEVPCAPCKHRSCSTLECLEQLQSRPVVQAGLALLQNTC